MKNILKISIVVAALASAVVACKDSFLDTPPQAALSNSTLASSKNGVNATLIAAYKSLIGWTGNWNENAWGTAPSNWTFNVAADDAHKGSEPGDGDDILTFQLYQWTPANAQIRSKWVATYEGVVRANSAINTGKEFLKNNPGDKTFADEVIGEATFLRAYYHFEAYKVWKNVPYYYETDTDFQKPNDQPVLPLIIKDLDAAIALLPANKTAKGRVDKTVATAFLGKVKLYNKDYTGALAAFNTVISSGKYSLADCFYDNFSVAGDNNSESLFAVQTSVNDGDGDGQNSNFGERLAMPHGSSPYGCCGFKNPTYDLAWAYKVDANGLPISTEGATLKRIEAGASDVLDPRIDWTMGRTDVPYLDWGVQKNDWIRGSGYAGWYSPKKNAHAKNDASLSGSWAGAQLSNLNVELLRYSDVLLMAAECEVEVGDLNKARAYVNQIRKRAGNCAQGKSAIAVPINSPEITWAKYKVGEYTAAWTNKDAAREAVRTERRLELALEGHRIFDLQRWGTLPTVIKSYLSRESKLVSVLTTALQPSDKNVAYPLPSTEIDRSGGKLKQNSGF
ncbi:MAG: RagB/SusD family nutrient uptake outer membrane protein [Emticicia sp.]|uniref:RagB/SusD family nutrient uptake outer membrane protein n=1 Tax=Emticicia sp. TaxID=1930953 RepID=UPI003BA7EF6D